MARKRMIDPNIWLSEDFSKLSTLAKLVFIGLFSNADDEGRGRAKPAYIKSILFPYDEAMRVTDIDRTLTEIASHMSITFYLHDGNEYYTLENWSKWQRIDRPSPSALPELTEHSSILRRADGEGSPRIPRAFPPKEKENINESKQKDNMEKILSGYGLTPDVKRSVLEWLEYKNERREGYRPAGLNKLLAQVADRLKSGGADEIIRAIAESMACNYSGIIWARAGNRNPLRPTGMGEYEVAAQRALKRVREELR